MSSAVPGTDLYYKMLYCDQPRCLVNTFEHGPQGECPGCGMLGEEIVS